MLLVTYLKQSYKLSMRFQNVLRMLDIFNVQCQKRSVSWYFRNRIFHLKRVFGLNSFDLFAGSQTLSLSQRKHFNLFCSFIEDQKILI